MGEIERLESKESTHAREHAPESMRPLLNWRCYECLDTNIAITLLGVTPCTSCTGARERRNTAAWRLARCVFQRQERKQEIDLLVLNVARILTHFTSETPLSRELIEVHLRLSERYVKKIIEKLRKEWLLPVGSRKLQPSGYWIISSAAEFIEWHRHFRSQAISEFATAYHLLRHNFPELAGQESFDFINTVKGELEEAIR